MPFYLSVWEVELYYSFVSSTLLQIKYINGATYTCTQGLAIDYADLKLVRQMYVTFLSVFAKLLGK